MRTVPSWFTMDHLAAKLEATVFFRTRPTVEAPAPVVAADAPATPSLHVAADKTRSIWSAPALPTLPSPSSSTSDLDDPPAPDPLPAGLLVERHGVARRAALPREESATARRREARFNPLDTAARGAAHTQRRTIERS
ncbi:hypothetical protein AURDEDRAFT_184045 [Auricularia subglabra TFB-10046 SS5]|nr:hypothetical protein AURDEDRAFT_184045 [Auricularia subglabra TFB-10046 SS5]